MKKPVSHVQEEQPTNVMPEEQLVHEIDGDQLPPPRPKTLRMVVLGVYVVLVLLGIGTGYLLARPSRADSPSVPSVVKTDKGAGSSDTKTFKDSAEGVLEKGGIDGEGTHKLIRDGGPSQTAYLISSVIDLDEYIGKKVKVWGQTIAAKKAAWLMDVGKIEVQ